MTGRLTGRVAIVTGAATGIGAAAVQRLSAEGARVMAAGLQFERLEAVAGAVGATAVECNVTDEASVRRLVDVTIARHQRLDIVVNAAGVVAVDDVASVEDAAWELMIDVNLTGTMRVCRASLPSLIANGGGAVVNIASVAAFNGSAGMASYAASKAGIVALTRAIANRYGADRVRANCVCPGWVRTPMSEAEMRETAAARHITVEAAFAELEARIALRRIGVPEEIAAAIAFLASEDASFVTGAVLVADGGARTPAAARGL